LREFFAGDGGFFLKILITQLSENLFGFIVHLVESGKFVPSGAGIVPPQ